MAKSALKRLLVAGGAPAWYRALNRSSLRILMYHRFAGAKAAVEESLSRQFTCIRRHYHPISLSEVTRRWQEGQPIPSSALVITVDDGYTDFSLAWPLLKAFDLPVTLFVVSGFVSGEVWLWPDVVHYCFSRSPLERVSLETGDGAVLQRSLATPADRQGADDDLDTQLIAMPDESRRSLIARLPEATGVTLPARIPEEYAPLTWEDLKTMSSQGLDIGAHTRTHPVLARIDSAQLLQQEVQGSKLEIEKCLDLPVHHFCYPNGQKSDFDSASIRAVQQAGFLSAATATRGLNGPHDSHWELRRIGVDPNMPADTFELELAGFRMA